MLIEADLLPPELMEKAKHFIAPLWDEKGKEAISGFGMPLSLHIVTP